MGCRGWIIMAKTKLHRISRRGEYQVFKAGKWIKVKGSNINPAKMKRWRDLARKREKKER